MDLHSVQTARLPKYFPAVFIFLQWMIGCKKFCGLL